MGQTKTKQMTQVILAVAIIKMTGCGVMTGSPSVRNRVDKSQPCSLTISDPSQIPEVELDYSPDTELYSVTVNTKDGFSVTGNGYTNVSFNYHVSIKNFGDGASIHEIAAETLQPGQIETWELGEEGPVNVEIQLEFVIDEGLSCSYMVDEDLAPYFSSDEYGPQFEFVAEFMIHYGEIDPPTPGPGPGPGPCVSNELPSKIVPFGQKVDESTSDSIPDVVLYAVDAEVSIVSPATTSNMFEFVEAPKVAISESAPWTAKKPKLKAKIPSNLTCSTEAWVVQALDLL